MFCAWAIAVENDTDPYIKIPIQTRDKQEPQILNYIPISQRLAFSKAGAGLESDEIRYISQRISRGAKSLRTVDQG